MRLSRPSPVRWPLVVMLAAPGSAAAHPLARLAPAPARTTGEGPDADSDEVTTRGMPGAETATRGDASAAVASGATADAGAEGFRPWEVGGFVDANYSFNSNLPDNHVNRLRSAVPRTGEFSLNLAVAYIRRDAVPGQTSPTFELALQAGPAADALMYYEPEPGGADSRFAGKEVFKHIGRANVGVKLKRGTELSAGMHLSPTFGHTVDEIEQAGLRVTARIPVEIESGTGAGMAIALGQSLIGMVGVFESERPDLVVVLGDRGEMLAGALAAIHLNIPVAHIHG